MKYNFIIILLGFHTLIFSQTYFQQKVDYNLNVTLDDQKHQLKVIAKINYHNNSKDTLSVIKLHFWANAHQSQTNSPLAQQLLEKNNIDWYFAKDNQLGGYSKIDITVQNKKLTCDFEDASKEIGTIKLPELLYPNSSVQLQVEYELKIPFLISRLGHVNNEYAISQWYPKPAVYDRNGWNTMPYLDQGEFYSEFGDYIVQITFPENYIVASTGSLESEIEKNWISNIVNESETDRLKRTGQNGKQKTKKIKTITFSAKQVHDFAWFASEKYIVNHSIAKLKSGKAIDVYSYYYPSSGKIWHKSTSFASRAIQFFSDEIDEYPYPQISVVNGDLKAGGGMEYPMITLLSNVSDASGLDQIIAHELAHNWFYGILASNERRHPWMDEGFTSFYEQKYMKNFYKNNNSQLPFFMHKSGDYQDHQVFHRLMTYKNEEEPGNQSSEVYSRLGYLNAAYSKPTICLEMLEDKLGKDKFKKCIQNYFEHWKFKHPSPMDCEQSLGELAGENINWLFDDCLMSNKKMDIGIKDITYKNNNWQVELRNNGDARMPIPITLIDKDNKSKKIWVDPFAKDTILHLKDNEIKKVKIDAEGISIDNNINNNAYTRKSWFNCSSPWSISILPKIIHPNHHNLFLTPVPAFNNNDKLMLGLAAYNDFIPSKDWEAYVVPLYSFKTNSLIGMAGVERYLYPNKSVFNTIHFGTNYQSFHYNTDKYYNYFDRYHRSHSWIEASIESQKQSLSFSINNTLIYQHFGEGIDFNTKKFEYKIRNYYVNEFAINYHLKSALNPFSAKISFQQGDGFLKAFAHLYQNIKYAKPKKGLNGDIQIHLFAGAFMNYGNPEAAVNFRMSGTTGFEYFQKDYRYEYAMIGRNENKNSFWSQQIFMQDAGLKTLSNLGSSSKYAVGFGFKDGIPLPLPIQYYFDAMIYPDYDFNTQKFKANIAYSGGLSLVLLKDQIEVYFPIFDSQNIKDNLLLQDRIKFLQKVTFLFDFKKWNPYEFTRNISF